MTVLVTTPDIAERLITEGLIDLPTAIKLLPLSANPRGSEHPISIGALWRWITRGKAGVRLEGLRFHDEWWTSKPAVARFLAALSAKESR
jgi:hypothetical protein